MSLEFRDTHGIRERVRSIALAGLLASTLLAGAMTSAHAESKGAVAQGGGSSKTTDDGTRCSIQTGPGQFDFYMPGDTITVPVTDEENPFGKEHEFACGVTGNWVQMDRRVTLPPSGPRGAAGSASTTVQPARTRR